MLRAIDAEHNENLRAIVERIYQTFCGYIHANYAHIMETYNGHSMKFELAGVPDERQRKMWMEHVELAATDVLHMAAFIAEKFGLKKLHHEIVQSWS